MKYSKDKVCLGNASLRSVWPVLGVVALLSAMNAGAANSFFDQNGTAPGSGIVDGGSYPWEGAFWAINNSGTVATAAWAEGDFPEFSTGSDATGSYAVTAGSPHHIAGALMRTSTATVTLNGADLTIDPPQQGFFASGFLVINNKLTGTGGIVPQSGQLFLNGDNDFSGGLGVGPGLLNFGHNHAFGTGTITIGSNGRALISTVNGLVVTNPFNVTVATGSGLNMSSTGSSSTTTFSGNWSVANTIPLGVGGGVGNTVVLSGVISGAGGLSRQVSTTHGTLLLTGANTYTGKTSFQSSVTSVNSLNSVSSPAQQVSSNLGKPSNAASGTLSFGSAGTSATLLYTGPGETTDRVLDLAGTTGGATIQADGTGPVVFTGANTASGSGIKTLTLTGSNAGANTLSGRIVDSASGATKLAKAGTGLWKLNGTNTYTGGTAINAGTLEIGSTGSLAGNVTNNSGVLQLDSRTNLSSGATLALFSSLANGAVNLNYTGTQTVIALFIDGTPQASGTWGSPASTAQNQNAIFGGTGVINVPSAPQIVQQPKSLSTYPQTPSRTFTVSVTGDPPTYQWKRNNNNLTDDGITISGSQTSQLTLFPPYTAGTYTCGITNTGGFTNTQPATLTILATNDYVNAVLASGPVAYWRLDETSGTAANDWVGLHQGVYVNANLNQPGFSAAAGSDPGMGIPANASQKGFMVISNATPDFSFPTASAAPLFTFEAWGMSTNFGAGVKQRLISTLTLSGAGGYGFGLPDSQHLQLTAGGVDEFDALLSTPLAAGVWYHFAATCDGNNFTLYINGNPVGSTNNSSGFNIPASPGQFTVGNNPLAYPGEQFYGAIDEVAIYNQVLDQTTITNHYLARYTDLTAPTVTTPVVTPPTNYVSLSATLTEAAGGAGLTYQWYRGPGFGSPIGGATFSTLALGPLQLSDATSYHCFVTDAGSHTADSPLASLAVLPIPSSASELNLTNALVLHLPFDTDYKDISGRVNNGAAVGSPTLAGSAEIGSGALHYGTTNGIATNYVTVGVRPDLQFDVTNDFTVGYWVRGTLNTNLPFFCDASGGLSGIVALNGGFYFGPNTTGNGGWAVGVGSAAHVMTASGGTLINDGNWHYLVHTVKRAGNVTTYVDGVNVDSHAVSFVSDSINTTNAANVGQDGRGAQVFTQEQEGDIDDLAVWRRTLTSLEVSGVYLAGATNHVSFAPAIAIVPVALQVQQVAPGQYQIVWTGPGTLTASGNVLGTYTNVSSASSPYTIPTSSGPQLFYRLKY
jgi:autotransporter-associated beta strand protein